MRRHFLTLAAGAMLLAATTAHAAAADEHPAVKRPFELPPSADLAYEISARKSGFSLKGEALIAWRAGEGKYAVSVESRVALLGKITENRSQGAIDSFGLAPAEFYEKRFHKDPTTANFDREARSLGFTDGDKTYPLKGGEQDRASVTWQLAAVARAAGDKFHAGSTWTFFVAGRNDAEPWTFRVIKREKVGTGVGELDAVHVMREQLPGAQGQSLDIWFAPEREWYPVKIRFNDDDKDYIEQTLTKITRK